MSRPWWSYASLGAVLLGAAFAGCFRGDFLLGKSCGSDDECGPRLRCEEGYCGGVVPDMSSSGPSQPEECGNGVLDLGEACDEAGETPTCNADCTEAACQDSVLNTAAGEECEDGVALVETCESLGFPDGGDLGCAQCSYDTSGCLKGPGIPVLDFEQTKQFVFRWAAVEDIASYQILESLDGETFEPVGEPIDGTTGESEYSVSLSMPLHLRTEASYRLRSCNQLGSCIDSEPLSVASETSESDLHDAVGYFKAAVLGSWHKFGQSVALSADGGILAVGAWGDESFGNASGAVHVFTSSGGLDSWVPAYEINADVNVQEAAQFGFDVAMSGDGDTLVIGAPGEDEGEVILNAGTGAVYIMDRPERGGMWLLDRRLTAPTPLVAGAAFGDEVTLSAGGTTLAVSAEGESKVYIYRRADREAQWDDEPFELLVPVGHHTDNARNSLSLSADGETLAVGAPRDSSNVAGISTMDAAGSCGVPNQNNCAEGHRSGAVRIYVLDGTEWDLQAYIKASNRDVEANFGWGTALSSDGDVLAVGARFEDNAVSGVGIGDEIADCGTKNEESCAEDSGAVYMFVREGSEWTQEAYIKASNPAPRHHFGYYVVLSGDGATLVVGAEQDHGASMGFDQANDCTFAADECSDVTPQTCSTCSGAAYVFVDDGGWSQQTYIKAPNTGAKDRFGSSLAMTPDGAVLAVGAHREGSNATDVNGDQTDDSQGGSGAVYLF